MLVGQRLMEHAPLPEVLDDGRIGILYKGAVPGRAGKAALGVYRLDKGQAVILSLIHI